MHEHLHGSPITRERNLLCARSKLLKGIIANQYQGKQLWGGHPTLQSAGWLIVPALDILSAARQLQVPPPTLELSYRWHERRARCRMISPHTSHSLFLLPAPSAILLIHYVVGAGQLLWYTYLVNQTWLPHVPMNLFGNSHPPDKHNTQLYHCREGLCDVGSKRSHKNSIDYVSCNFEAVELYQFHRKKQLTRTMFNSITSCGFGTKRQ